MLTKLPKGYFLEWSGQYENLIRSEKTLKLILPVVLLIIFICMYLAFHSAREAFFSLISIPFALIGGAFMVYFWGVNLSVAVAVGFIALFGLAVETGIVMVIYLNDAMQQLVAKKGNSAETITSKRFKRIRNCRCSEKTAAETDDSIGFTLCLDSHTLEQRCRKRCDETNRASDGWWRADFVLPIFYLLHHYIFNDKRI